MKNTAHLTSTPSAKSRDWIAVDQLVQRLTDAAPDEFERDVVRLAAEISGGPDPDVAGGGQAWQDAITDARKQLQAAFVEDLDAKEPVTTNDTPAIARQIAEVLSHADLNDFDRDRLSERLVALFSTQIAETRKSERQIISDWLMARAARMGSGGSVVVDAQARALASAAARLENTPG